jgi:predicted nucleic-acid-binding protein
VRSRPASRRGVVAVDTNVLVRLITKDHAVQAARATRLFEREQVQALAWLDAGIDFADGLHLASRGGAKSFVTFDERFVKRTAKLNISTRLL